MLRHFVPIAVALVALAVIPACPGPHPVVAPTVDATDAAPGPRAGDGAPVTPCQAACATLAGLGCPEGAWDDCVTRLAQWDGARIIRTASGQPLTCAELAGVTSQPQARAAGVTCTVSP